jgi:hypothetical protein
MHVCFLRAGLSRATGSSRFVLGNPKAWLGTAYHEVLEKIVEVDLDQETLDAAVERLWNQAIATQQQRADAHALDRRFGSPTAWPGYHVARASVALRIQELSAGPAPAAAPTAKQALAAGRWVCDSDHRHVREAGQDPVELGAPARSDHLKASWEPHVRRQSVG